MPHPNVKTEMVDTVYLPKRKLIYRGNHNIIAYIAKMDKCSMNKARKKFTEYQKTGVWSFIMVDLMPNNNNKRIYSEEALKESLLLKNNSSDTLPRCDYMWLSKPSLESLESHPFPNPGYILSGEKDIQIRR